MPGGKGKINEYNKSLTPEQRKASAKRAAQAKRKSYSLKQIAKMISEAPAQDEAKKGLEKLGIEDEAMTNNALIVAAVFRAAFQGDMKAVEKWEKYIGQHDSTDEEAGNGLLAELIDGLKE